jgi:hypothetical protein
LLVLTIKTKTEKMKKHTLNLIIQPDPDDNDAAEVYVDGIIGGHSYRFLLDTGAARTSVIADAYTATFESTDTHTSSGVFAAASNDLIVIPRLDLGPISRENWPVVRAANKPTQVSNLIGMDILKDIRCHFLFDENRVLIDDDSAADRPQLELFLDTVNHPYVDLQFEAAHAKAVWDTGAGITVVDMAFVAQNSAYFTPAGYSTGTDSTGTQRKTSMFMMSKTIIGDHPFPPHRVAGVDLSPVNATIEVPMNLILGYSTLSKANWLFDFPRKRWAITKSLSGSAGFG